MARVSFILVKTITHTKLSEK
ncbi:hypothetical protein OIU79_019413 [Salix purpurea]|uniref:Uncharacterized protein n=1 Tax=Salix purpurea TaxID=77065 RepID=A0A9Q0P150_SALPP|nr:hypothetical protein OIU79_019413 [Salix purpurea]